MMSVMLQSPRPAFAVGRQGGRIPILHRDQPALERLDGELPPRALIGEWHMAQWPRPFNKVSAAVPVGGFGRIRLVFARMKNSVRQPR